MYKSTILCLFLALPATVLSVPTTLQKDLDTIQARDTPSTSDWGIDTGIDTDGPQYGSTNHEETNADGTTSSTSTINANIPGGPHLNYHDNHEDHHYVPPPPPSTPTVVPPPPPTSSVPVVTPIVTPTPTPSWSASPPPPPPVISSPAPTPEPEPEEEIGGCVAPGADDEPEESAGECPCEDRFGTLEAKLESIARQLDELKSLQAQMLHK